MRKPGRWKAKRNFLGIQKKLSIGLHWASGKTGPRTVPFTLRSGYMPFPPRPALSFLMTGALAAGLIASLDGANPEEEMVLAPVQAMFDGMTKRDAAAIKEPLLPRGTMVLMRD